MYSILGDIVIFFPQEYSWLLLHYSIFPNNVPIIHESFGSCIWIFFISVIAITWTVLSLETPSLERHLSPCLCLSAVSFPEKQANLKECTEWNAVFSVLFWETAEAIHTYNVLQPWMEMGKQKCQKCPIKYHPSHIRSSETCKRSIWLMSYRYTSIWLDC